MARFVGFIIAISMLWGGGQGLYVWLKNPEPTTLSCSEYLNEANDAEWLRLTDCQLDGYSFAFPEGKADKEIYVPIRAADSNPETTAKAVALITDKKIIEKINIEPQSQDFNSTVIEGMIQFGIEKDDDLAEQIDNVINVVSNPIVIIYGEKPNVAFSGIMFSIGLIIIFAMFFLMARKRKNRNG